MNKAKVVATLLAMFVSLPIWFYLLYKILEAVQASELMWFLYWVYLPANIFITLVVKLSSGDD
jgi:hypothetical protein